MSPPFADASAVPPPNTAAFLALKQTSNQQSDRGTRQGEDSILACVEQMNQYVGRYKYMPTEKNNLPPLELAARAGILRLRDFERAGVSRTTVRRSCEAGKLARVGRGLYSLPARALGENESLLQVAARVPSGVICLLSALRFHDLTDQNPSEVWLAIERKSRRPQLDWPALQVVWWPRKSLEFGIVETTIDGISIRLTSPAKTVADCFKHRSKVGTDVAIVALRQYRRSRGSIDELLEAARIDRVERLIRTYLEAIV